MKKLQLILTNPCAENWDTMPAVTNGRYCDVCTKNIVDLTNKTDIELIDFFKRKKEDICGRLLSTQLNRELHIPTEKPNWYWLMPIALGASLLSTSSVNGAEHLVVVQPTHHYLPNRPSEKQANSVLLPAEEVKGTVIDLETGKALIGVKIRWKDFNNVIATTDSSGNFSITVNQEQKSNRVIFEKAGYGNVETALTNNLVVKMSEVRVIRLGGVTSITTTNKPLYVIYAGNKSCVADEQQWKNINPDWIEDIKILKGAEATSLYGSKAANGAIVIGLKKEFKRKIDFSRKD